MMQEFCSSDGLWVLYKTESIISILEKKRKLESQAEIVFSYGVLSEKGGMFSGNDAGVLF